MTQQFMRVYTTQVPQVACWSNDGIALIAVQGLCRSSTVCPDPTCAFRSTTSEPFMGLTLALPCMRPGEPLTLAKCLEVRHQGPGPYA